MFFALDLVRAQSLSKLCAEYLENLQQPIDQKKYYDYIKACRQELVRLDVGSALDGKRLIKIMYLALELQFALAGITDEIQLRWSAFLCVHAAGIPQLAFERDIFREESLLRVPISACTTLIAAPGL